VSRARFSLPTLLAAGLMLTSGAAGAQSSVGEEEECADAASPEEEVACLRAALAMSRRASAEAAGEATPAPAAPAPIARSAEPLADPVRPPATNSAATAALGGEQVGALQRNAEEIIAARLADYREDERGLLVMQLDNGQIWRQDESVGGPLRLGEAGQIAVEITRSGFGGYRMRIPEIGRRIAVSRLR